MTTDHAALDLQSVRAVLEKRRTALLADVRHDLHETCSGAETVQPDDAMDELDASAVLSQSDIRFTLMQLRAEALAALDAALLRIDSGSYGICESCGMRISPIRLRVLPFASRCVACQELNEETERAHNHDHSLMRRLREDGR